MSESITELRIWSGDRDIPSIHLESLQIWTYVKISGVPVKVQVSGNPLGTLKCSLPVLTHEKKHYCSFPEVVGLFSALNVDPDLNLDDTLKSNIAAYTAMLKEKLYPAIQYTWWLDRRNFEVVSRPTYAKASTWPLNFYYPAHFERKATDLLEALYSSTEDLDYISAKETSYKVSLFINAQNPNLSLWESSAYLDMQGFLISKDRVYGDAQICLNSLSTILGDKKYFFGDQLTSFDATLYAHLCPTLKKDFPNKKLESHIKGCSNLVKYVDRITEELFPDTYKEGRAPPRQETSANDSKNRAISKRTHIIVSALIAVTSLASFAFFAGVIDFGKKAAEDEESSENNQGPGSFFTNLYF